MCLVCLCGRLGATSTQITSYGTPLNWCLSSSVDHLESGSYSHICRFPSCSTVFIAFDIFILFRATFQNQIKCFIHSQSLTYCGATTDCHVHGEKYYFQTKDTGADQSRCVGWIPQSKRVNVGVELYPRTLIIFSSVHYTYLNIRLCCQHFVQTKFLFVFLHTTSQ